MTYLSEISKLVKNNHIFYIKQDNMIKEVKIKYLCVKLYKGHIKNLSYIMSIQVPDKNEDIILKSENKDGYINFYDKDNIINIYTSLKAFDDRLFSTIDYEIIAKYTPNNDITNALNNMKIPYDNHCDKVAYVWVWEDLEPTKKYVDIILDLINETPDVNYDGKWYKTSKECRNDNYITVLRFDGKPEKIQFNDNANVNIDSINYDLTDNSIH